MKILSHKLVSTNDELTSRAGLLTLAQLMETLQLGEHIDQVFPQPCSNRGFKASSYIEALILMQHQGYFHLDEVRHLHEEGALLRLLGMNTIPQSKALGNWLRRTGANPKSAEAWCAVNQRVLKTALHTKKSVTLDMDATEIIANKAEAKWTYKKNKGYMPMVGHISETDQVVTVDFREGNVPPAKDNLAFLQQCQRALPAGVTVKAVRIDAAGYQTGIIRYCDEQGIDYAIRAKLSASLKVHIAALPERVWQPMPDREGKATKQQTYRTSHCIGDYEQAFTLIIQRQPKHGQGELDLNETDVVDEYEAGGYIYRAIATNRHLLSDSDIIHWYNQRGQASENRIKELKRDLGGNTLPSSDFEANALYFRIAALSYNLFALMRQLLPEALAQHRAMTIRWKVYAIAAKIVKTARQRYLKMKAHHVELLEQLTQALKQIRPPPIEPIPS